MLTNGETNVFRLFLDEREEDKAEPVALISSAIQRSKDQNGGTSLFSFTKERLLKLLFNVDHVSQIPHLRCVCVCVCVENGRCL